MRLIFLIPVLMLASCMAELTPAMRSEVIAVEDKFDTAWDIAENEGIPAAAAHTREARAVSEDLPEWMVEIAGLIAGLLGLNFVRNRSRKKVLDQWE